MKKLFGKKKDDEHNFWMSYTDLMSGFLIVFIIIGIVMFHEYSSISNKLKPHVNDSINIDVIIKKAAAYDVLNKKHKETIHELDSINSSNLRNEITKFDPVFRAAVKNLPIHVEVDEKRGSIKLTHSGGGPKDDLFDTNERKVTYPLGDYIDNLLEAGFIQTAEEIGKNHDNIEIRIEGHTDPNWDSFEYGGYESFLKNLDLSTDRANAVYLHLIKKLNKQQRDFVMKHMISIGYSFSERINNDGVYEKNERKDAESRRIEFRILSK